VQIQAAQSIAEIRVALDEFTSVLAQKASEKELNTTSAIV